MHPEIKWFMADGVGIQKGSNTIIVNPKNPSTRPRANGRMVDPFKKLLLKASCIPQEIIPWLCPELECNMAKP